MDITQKIKDCIIQISNEYATYAADHYDFWNQHIKLVVREALFLAEQYQADKEIVELGALLHDIALMTNTGKRADHHINGKILADQILSAHNYPDDKKARVLNCILHHRSSQYAETPEELCVADADILAHYDNIPMCFCTAYRSNITSIPELRVYFEKDFNDLSEQTKQIFKPRYDHIMEILFGNLS